MNKKIVSIILAVLLITLIFQGCGKTNTNDTQGTPSDTLDTTTPEKKDDTPPLEEKKEEELIPPGTKLTYWTGFTGGAMASSPADVIFYQELQKAVGIDLEFISNTGSGEQLAILAASDDLPDIIEDQWKKFPGGIHKSLADELIIPLNDLMDEGYFPNFTAYLAKDVEVDRMCKTDDGIYYNTPMIRLPDSFLVFGGLIIRDDWLNDLGLEAPKSISELENVLTQFKDKKGASGVFSAAGNDYGRFLNAFNVKEDFLIGEDGKVRYGYIEPNYKDFLILFNKWMKSGLLDPDIFTQNNDAMYAKIATGKIGALTGNTGSQFNKFATMYEQNSDMHFIPIATPSAYEGEPMKVSTESYRVKEQGASISSKCKYPKAAA